MFEITEQDISKDDLTSVIRKWSNITGKDAHFYHVTTNDRATRIRVTGLYPERTLQIYPRGKILFYERSGVAKWIDKVSQYLLQQDNAEMPKISIVRFKKSMVRLFYKDKMSTRNSMTDTYYVTDPIKIGNNTTLSV